MEPKSQGSHIVSYVTKGEQFFLLKTRHIHSPNDEILVLTRFLTPFQTVRTHDHIVDFNKQHTSIFIAHNKSISFFKSRKWEESEDKCVFSQQLASITIDINNLGNFFVATKEGDILSIHIEKSSTNGDGFSCEILGRFRGNATQIRHLKNYLVSVQDEQLVFYNTSKLYHLFSEQTQIKMGQKALRFDVFKFPLFELILVQTSPTNFTLY